MLILKVAKLVQQNKLNYSLLEVLDQSTSMCEHIEEFSRNKERSVTDPSRADNFRKLSVKFGKLSIALGHAFIHTSAVNEIFEYLKSNEFPTVKPDQLSDNAWKLYSHIVNPSTITMYENNIPLFYCDLSKTHLSGE